MTPLRICSVFLFCLALTPSASRATDAAPAPSAPTGVTIDKVTDETTVGSILAPSDVRYEPKLGTSRNRVRLGLDRADGLTRAEFWISSIYYGAWTGVTLFSGIADLNANVSFPLSLVGVSGGIAGAYVFRRHFPELNGGTLAAIDLGLWAGLLDGVLIGSLGASQNVSVKTRNRIALGTGWALSSLGAVGGGLLAHRLGATTGDIGLLASTTFWGAATGVLINFTARGRTSGNWQVPLAALAGSMAGTATGAGLVSKFDVSRTRSLFIDLGGVSGMLLSLAIVEGSPRLQHWSKGAWGLLLGGELVGLAAGALATWKLDTPLAQTPIAVRFTPTAMPIQSADKGQTQLVPGLAMAGSF